MSTFLLYIKFPRLYKKLMILTMSLVYLLEANTPGTGTFACLQTVIHYVFVPKLLQKTKISYF